MTQATLLSPGSAEPQIAGDGMPTAPGPPDLLSVRDLHVTFDAAGGEIEAVRGVSFRVPQRGTVALVGESGSGKSVVSQAIMGLLPRIGRIARGQILFADPRTPGTTVDIAKLDPNSGTFRALRGGRISIIFQEPMTSLSPLHSIGNQIREAVRLHRPVSDGEAREMSADMLNLVGFKRPKDALKSYPFELSGGLRQRAMIAMALVCRPALLIADEPTTALDVTIQAQILKLIHDLQEELDMALLLITHDLGVVANVAREVVVMYHGQIMESGSVEEIFHDPSHPYLRALLAAVPRFDMAPGERLQPIRELKQKLGGQMMRSKEAWPADAEVKPLLYVRGVIKRFYGRRRGGLFGSPGEAVTAVDGINLSIERGEILGLVGESGCGKSTLCKVLMRAVVPDEGRILFNDHGKQVDVAKLRGADLTRFRRKVQYMFQDPFGSLNPRMTVQQIVGEPLVIHKIGTSESRREMVLELIGLVGLDQRHLNRYPHSFSGGQRQRIGIARALALKPDLLICDEPVSALDVSIQAQVLNLLKDLRQELGLTYLFITHNLAVVNYVADRIAVMCAGRIVEVAARERLFSNPLHPYTRALLAAVPAPDVDDKLDFSLVAQGRNSNPALWPEPFLCDGDCRPTLIEIEPGHWIQAMSAPALEVAA